MQLGFIVVACRCLKWATALPPSFTIAVFSLIETWSSLFMDRSLLLLFQQTKPEPGIIFIRLSVPWFCANAFAWPWMYACIRTTFMILLNTFLYIIIVWKPVQFKKLNLSFKKRMSFRFGTTWGKVKSKKFSILGDLWVPSSRMLRPFSHDFSLSGLAHLQILSRGSPNQKRKMRRGHIFSGILSQEKKTPKEIFFLCITWMSNTNVTEETRRLRVCVERWARHTEEDNEKFSGLFHYPSWERERKWDTHFRDIQML